MFHETLFGPPFLLLFFVLFGSAAAGALHDLQAADGDLHALWAVLAAVDSHGLRAVLTADLHARRAAAGELMLMYIETLARQVVTFVFECVLLCSIFCGCRILPWLNALPGCWMPR